MTGSISPIKLQLLVCFLITHSSSLVLGYKSSNETTHGDSTLRNSVQQNSAKAVPLEPCSLKPLTGFFRDGYCRTADEDYGSHTVCAQVTKDFLEFTKSRGNDLSTPNGRSFPGLKPGDYWCLCAVRWLEAFKMGKITPIKVKATNEKALNVIPMDILDKVDDVNVIDSHDEL